MEDMKRETVMQWAQAISRNDVIAPRTLIGACRFLYGSDNQDSVTVLAAGLQHGPRAFVGHVADLLARQGETDVLIEALRQADENVTAEVLRVIATQSIEASDVDQWLTLHEAVERALSSADPAARRHAVKVATVNEMVDLSGALAGLPSATTARSSASPP
jgi:hypothetical protein